jgi:hypothetical protein
MSPKIAPITTIQLAEALKPLECFQSVRIEWTLSKPSSEYVGKWKAHFVNIDGSSFELPIESFALRVQGDCDPAGASKSSPSH